MEAEIKKAACNIVADYIYHACMDTHNFLQCNYERVRIEHACVEKIKDVKIENIVGTK